MKNFKIIIEYDGTNYNGWQAQKSSNKLCTIQGTLEEVLKRLFCKKVSVVASGRTDAGVHAVGQCASFKVNTKIPIQNIIKALNTYLPPDIKIRDIREVPLSFNARFSAKKKWYRYTIINKKTPAVLDRGCTVHYPYRLNVALMKKAAKIIKGKHDFSAIILGSDKNNVRNIYKLSVSKKREYIFIDVIGNGFLYKMVRRIAGILIDVGRKKMKIEDVKNLINRKKINCEVQTAPAKGLCLIKVYY